MGEFCDPIQASTFIRNDLGIMTHGRVHSWTYSKSQTRRLEALISLPPLRRPRLKGVSHMYAFSTFKALDQSPL